MKTILSSRRHYYLARISIFLIVVALIAGIVGCGNTTPTPTGGIRDWYDLNAIRNKPAGNYTLMNDLDSNTPGYDELARPMANGGKGWWPITTFDGNFDGQGFEIRDLFINRPDESHVGLFGDVGEGIVIENVGVVNTDVTGNDWVGGLVGYNRGTVSNCYVTGNVTGGSWVGGLAGHNSGNVSSSYSTGSVTGNDWVGGLVGWNGGPLSNSYFTGSVTGNSSVGGLMGVNGGGTVSNSYYNYDEILINGENIITTGALFDEDFQQWLANDKFLDVNGRLSQEDGYYLINDVNDFKQLLVFGQNHTLKFRLTNDLDLATEPNFYIPYLAGEFDGDGHKISNLSFSFDFVTNAGLFGQLAPGGKVIQVGIENVNITGDLAVGGLVGGSSGTVSNSYSTGSVTGTYGIGGLVGYNSYGTVSNCYSSGSVTGNYSVGGLVGDNYGGIVSNCYSTGSVTGTDAVGGLAGANYGGGTVSNCYSTGSVTGNSYVGGLVAYNVGTVDNSFWDIETSGQGESAGGTGKTTAEMKDITTFSGAAWDICVVGGPGERNPAYIWNIVDDVTYPFLSWQP